MRNFPLQFFFLNELYSLSLVFFNYLALSLYSVSHFWQGKEGKERKIIEKNPNFLVQSTSSLKSGWI